MASITTVDTSLTTIAHSSSRYAEFIGFQIVNGAIAFNAFQVQARMSPDADWVTIQSSGFTAGNGFAIAWATAELATLGSGTSAILYLLGKHAWEVRLRASVAAGSSLVTVYANAGA